MDSFKETDSTSDSKFSFPNLLIKGNNLLALHSLKANKQIYGKVKLIYIDPPYNTGNDSFNYNDRFNHSTWLVFMKNRLEIAREFLRDDGVIFVQCDDNEQAYLKVLMDEIFGRENFDSCITHIVKPEGRMYGNIAKTHEYILIYAKNIALLEFDEIEKIEHKFDYEDKFGGFNLKNLENGNFRAFNSTNRPNLRFCLFVNINEQEENNLFKVHTKIQSGFIEINPTSKDGFDYIWRWSKEKCENELHNLCARKSANGEYLIYQKVRKSTTRAKSIFWDKEMITKKGTDEIKALFAPSLRGEAEAIHENLEVDCHSPKGLRNDEVSRDLNNDNTPLFATPKPEALLKRIIEISTNEGDLVLDFFAGSGTTLAVAHKMNRRYVGIEQMDYIESITKERLKKVVNGEQGGISKAVDFKGGGSFIYLELMPLNAMYKERILKAQSENELESIYKDLRQKAFLDYRVDLDEILKDSDFIELDLESKRKFLIKALDSNMDYVPLGDLEDKEFSLSNELIELNKAFYGREL